MKSLAKHGMTVAICLTLTLSGCGGKKTGDGKAGDNGKNGGTKIDHSSPEKVTESFKAALSKDDWPTAFKCMTPESQEMLVSLVLLPVQVATAFSKKAGKEDPKMAGLKDVLKKHGVDLEKDDPGIKNVSDKGTLFADVVNWMKENAPPDKKEQGFDKMKEQMAKTQITDAKIDGDSATAVLKVEGKPDETAYFKKIDDKWYIDFVKTMQNKKPSRGKGAPPFPN